MKDNFRKKKHVFVLLKLLASFDCFGDFFLLFFSWKLEIPLQ